MHAEWYANNKWKGEKHLKSVENYIDEKNTENGPKKVFFWKRFHLYWSQTFFFPEIDVAAKRQLRVAE